MRVFWRNQEMGSCILTKQGLYSSISCRMPMVSRQVCRLYAISSREKIRLGVLLPDGGALRMETKIATKKLPQENFFLCAEDGSESFFPVAADAPFGCMESLLLGKWETRQGIAGISISRDTGQ